MGRPPKVWWDEREGAWCSEVGEAWVDGKGRRRRRPVHFTGIGKAEQEKALRQMLNYRAGLLALEADPSAALTVRDVLESFMEWAERSREPRTVRGYAEVLPIVARHVPEGQSAPLHAKTARDLDLADVQSLVDRMTAGGYSPHYVGRIVRSIRAAWSWAAKIDKSRRPVQLVPANPLDDLKAPKIGVRPVRYVEQDLVERFLRWAWARASAKETELYRRFARMTVLLTWFIAETGCRPAEAIALTWDGIDLDRKVARVRNKLTTRTEQLRTIPLGRRARLILRLIRRIPDHHREFVFTHKRGRFCESRGAVSAEAGEPWKESAYQQAVRKLVLAAAADGLPVVTEGPGRFVPYAFRHSKISDDLMNGGNVHDVAVLHNTSVRVIETTYAHLTTGHLTGLAEEMERRRNEKRRPPPV